MKLEKHDHIVTAYAERASGPGWANAPVWCVVRSGLDGTFRLECLQPVEFSSEIATLYNLSAAAHDAMTHAVRSHMRKIKTKTK